MSDYPFFIPEVVLCANSSLFWFKVANEHREFRNYLILFPFHKPSFILYSFLGLCKHCTSSNTNREGKSALPAICDCLFHPLHLPERSVEDTGRPPDKTPSHSHWKVSGASVPYNPFRLPNSQDSHNLQSDKSLIFLLHPVCFQQHILSLFVSPFCSLPSFSDSIWKNCFFMRKN